MSVEIDPIELGFRRPFNQEVSQTLTIKNPSPTPIAFKVKTTAPKQYCVRPNSGRVESGQECEVTVLLQAMKQEPPMDYKCKDKFLVQSVAITGDREFSNLTTIWQKIGDNRSAIQEKKIRVVFLPADSGPTLNAANLSAAATTPQRQPLINGADRTPDHGVPPPSYSSPGDESHIGNVTAMEPGSSPDIAEEEVPMTAPIPSSLPSSSEKLSYSELESRLAEANSIISKLKSEDGLRQRKVASDSTSATDKKHPKLATARRGTEGVPVNIVAVLCLLAFLIAYIFF